MHAHKLSRHASDRVAPASSDSDDARRSPLIDSAQCADASVCMYVCVQIYIHIYILYIRLSLCEFAQLEQRKVSLHVYGEKVARCAAPRRVCVMNVCVHVFATC